MTSSILQVRIDRNLRAQADEIFNNLGFDMSSAVRLFLNRVVLEQGLPFPMNLKRPESDFDPVGFLNDYGNNGNGV
ncbi:MAG: type II toxin-antitoxin system RelB/DinJ family antitoxin [Treponema sp.]|nr:type II toxin-antitoxin system RelB/DinJ family antitoxin [Treponema sp.]MBR4004819.1 type II toxin-antitoxin system RelB/DinJ family antitoxin [Treponema sp.]